MLYVATKFEHLPEDAIVVDTTSSSGQWAGLSPFLLTGGRLYDSHYAQNVENGWQYAKVYQEHANENGDPTQAYWDWAQAGWKNKKAVRYPMGKGARPLYSLWRNEKLGYIEARKRIYCPLYARSVVKTQSFEDLRKLYLTSKSDIYLRDYDGYNHIAKNKTILECLEDPKKKFGHAFVLWMLLTQHSSPEFQSEVWLS